MPTLFGTAFCSWSPDDIQAVLELWDAASGNDEFDGVRVLPDRIPKYSGSTLSLPAYPITSSEVKVGGVPHWRIGRLRLSPIR